MKLLSLIFLSACIVAISHQQFYRQRPRGLLWWSPYYQPFPVDREDNFPFYRQLLRHPSRPPTYYENPDFNSDLTGELNSQNDMEGDGSPGTQSRIKASNPFLQDSFYNQQSNPRFLYPFGTTTSFYNPFFKTATFTLTSTLTLASIQSCVPSFQVSPVPVACRRKRNEIQDLSGEQFAIVPSETQKLEPTELLSSLRNSDQISSSKDGDTYEGTSTADHSREKRGFLINKNQFLVSSTLTTFAFVNRTVTVTVNLINPAPTAQCAAVADSAATPPKVQCVACLPAGFIVCPA